MIHSRHIRKFGREMGQRNALLKSLAVSLVRYGKIKTSEAKAKSLRPFVEKLVTHAKVGTIASQRLISSRLSSVVSASKLIKDIAPKFKTRAGGYIRIVKLPRRKSDGTKMAVIEFV